MLHLRKLIADSRGATAIEYALIASLISVAAIAGYHSLGGKVANLLHAGHRAERSARPPLDRQALLIALPPVRLACRADLALRRRGEQERHVSDEFDPMPSSRGGPSRRPTTIGNHKLKPVDADDGLRLRPGAVGRLAQGADLPHLDLRVRERGRRASASSKASPASGRAAAPPRGWSIRASTAPTRKSSRTGCRSGRTPRRR